MAATETRLLLLGAVMLFEPVNGYQLRRELLSWQVEDWAHVNPGSIYSGLATLARQGLVRRHDLVDGTRQVAVYTSTEAGRREFETLWRSAVETVDLLSPLPLHTAMALMPLVGRAEALESLRVRMSSMDARVKEQLEWNPPPGDVPPHVRALADLWAEIGRTEQQWLIGLVDRLERGDFALRGEPADWQAPADDPGWQMADDRRRYERLIAGSR
jgi:DNA-binding PadR family transcriptional regulator